jgi:hypothetical protein
MSIKDFSVNDGILEFCANYASSVITIPEGVTVIGKEVFENFECLKSVEMPNSVNHIGIWAFYMCKNLKNVKMSNNLNSIATGAFAECVNLEGLVLPNSVKYIGKKAFAECSSLKKISLPNSIEVIEDEAFSDCYALESVIIPDSVKSIGKNVFSGCEKLTIYYTGLEFQWNKVATNNIKGIRTIFNYSNKKVRGLLLSVDGMGVHSSISSNKESANSYFENVFHNTGKTLNFAINSMQKAGYSKSDIVSAILSVLGDVNWKD